MYNISGMSDWGWVKTEGNIGEMPVEIQPHRKAEFLQDYAENVLIRQYDLPEGMNLIPGDICILNAQIDWVETKEEPTEIGVTILDIEFVQRSDQRPDGEVERMMKHLEKAKESASSTDLCHHCSRVDTSTPLIIKRDLHACAECGRILTTEEYSKSQRY
jgi:hypothetical protein